MGKEYIMQERPLNNLMQQYSWGLLKKKEFEGLIFQYCLDNYKRFNLYRWDKDECTDYLCWLYPRISRAIDNYRNTGFSFDAYIHSLIRWSAREYRSREADHHITECACWDAKAADMVCSAEAAYDEDPEPREAFKPVVNPRQVLVLLLKSYYFVSDDFISRISPAIGVEQERIRRLIDELRKHRLQREERFRILQERIHCQYYRYIAMTKRTAAAPEGSALREKLRQRRERAKTRLDAMRKRLSAIRLEASNRQVAEVLGVPKGTVDSNLYALKSKWKKQLPET
jgi:DNA-directed RNA polymerase specialized sigma24 family protein